MQMSFSSQTLEICSKHLGIFKFRTLIISILLLVASILDGFSIITILPAVNSFQPSDESEISTKIGETLDLIGLQQNVQTYVLLIIILVLSKSFFIYFSKKIVGYEIADLSRSLRLSLITKYLNSKWLNIINFSQGEITNLMTLQVNRSTSLFGCFCDIISVFLNLIIYLSIALMISVNITLLSIFWSLSLIILMSYFLNLSKRAGKSQTLAGKFMSNKISDMFNSIKSQKVMGEEFRVINNIDTESIKLRNSVKKVVHYHAILAALQEVLLVLSLGILILYIYVNNILPLSEVLVLMIIFHRIFSQTVRIQSSFQKIYSNISSLEEIERTIKESIKNQENLNKNKTNISIFKKLKIVNLSISLSRKKILDKVNLSINANQITTIFGPSGSGKSTLVNVISGLLQPDKGDIFVDGKNLKYIDILAWRSKIGYIPQDIMLIDSSLRDNIIYGQKDIEDENIYKVLKLVKIDLKKEFPKLGLNTIIGDRGNKISGGQKQRIALARILIKKPNFIILDEPTSNLDKKTEKNIFGTFLEISKQIPVLVISHNENLIKKSDLCYELKEGKILKRKH